jgi:hypothetical protein
MRTLIFLILQIACVITQNAYGAIGNTAVWEVEQNATASDVNGGGFDPGIGTCGTDYSQQAAAQFSFTDLATTTGTTTCVVTSASHNFVSTDSCNAVHINSGTSWTAGWYFITSVSGNAATLDRACGSAATLTAGTWHEGGALSWQASSTTTWAAAISAGNTIWIKYSATQYTFNGSIAITDSTVTHQGLMSGYNTVRGDNPTGANRPVLNLVGSSNDVGAYTVVQNLIFTGNAVTPMSSDGFTTWQNNKFMNTSTSSGHFGVGNGADDLFINNEIISQAGFGASNNGDSTFYGNYFHDTPTCYRFSGTAPMMLLYNIFVDCPTAAISITAAEIETALIANNTLKGGNVQGVGVSVASGAGGARLVGNIITDFATGISATTANTNQWSNWNDFFSNTTNRTNWTAGASDYSADPGFQSVKVISGSAGTVSGSVLTDAAADFTSFVDNTDYVMFISGSGLTVTPGSILGTSHTTHSVTLATAPGGSGSNVNYVVVTGHNFLPGPNVVNKAFPGIFPGALTTGFLSSGAVQKLPGFPRKSGGQH